MKSGRRRGSLLMVMAAAVMLLLIGFTLASITLADLSFASSFRTGVCDDLLARAAIAQFKSDADKLRHGGFTPPPSHVRVADWLARYQNAPVFPDGGQHLPGTAEITFDSSKDFFSVDNSQGTTPVAGWLDKGLKTLSVPPLCVSLIVTTQSGSQASHYEALLQCRWPYALVSPPPIRMGGSPVPIGSKIVNSLTVSGPILMTEKPDTSLSGPPKPMYVPSNMFQTMSQTFPPDPDPVPIRLGYPAPASDPGGNRLVGRVDSAAGDNVTVAAPAKPPNVWTGRARAGDFALRKKTDLAKLFAMPNRGSFPDRLLPENLSIISATPNNLYLLTVPSGQTNPQVILGPANITNSTPPQAFFVDGSLSNVDLKNNITTNATLNLRNASLFVDGDLDLSVGGIKGDNATLIVNGNLVLKNGVLDAANNGMVILCKRLCASATGSYRGLILVQESAVFVEILVPDPLTPYYLPLAIRGGVICGGGPVKISVYPSNPPPPPPFPPTPTVTLEGFRVCGADFTYDPRYLTSLNNLADYELIRYRRLD